MGKNIKVKVNDVLIDKEDGKKFMVGKVYRNNELMITVEIETPNPTTRVISKDELLYGYYEINSHYNFSNSNNTSCVWTLDEIGEYANIYTTSCQEIYYDDQTSLEANGFNHCLFCGRKMKLEYGK